MKRTFSFTRTRRALVVGMGLCFIAATYGLVRLAYGLLLPDIQAETGLTTSTAGYISSGGSIMYCLAAGLSIVLAPRNPRVLVVAAAVTACGGVWGMAASGSIVLFGASAIISSAGAGFASPAMVSIVQRTLGPDGAAQSTVNSGTGPGLVAAGLLTIAAPDWRATWIVVGVITAAFAVGVLTVDTPSTQAPRPELPSSNWIRRHTRVVTAAFLLGSGSSAVWTYGRTLLVDAGSASERGTVIAWITLGVGATAMALTARFLADRAPTTAWMITAGAMTIGIAALALDADFTVWTLAAFAAFGWGFTAATSALIAWTTYIDADRAPAGTSVVFVALVAGQAAGATALGFAVETLGFAAAFTAAALVSAAAVGIAHERPVSSRKPAPRTGAATFSRESPARGRRSRTASCRP